MTDFELTSLILRSLIGAGQIAVVLSSMGLPA